MWTLLSGTVCVARFAFINRVYLSPQAHPDRVFQKEVSAGHVAAGPRSLRVDEQLGLAAVTQRGSVFVQSIWQFVNVVA